MSICVVHLIREKNGVKPFKSFLNSYLKYSSGIKHDILFILKKNNSLSDLKIYKNLLVDIPHKLLTIPDKGFDIDSYFLAARKTNYKYYLFLNSFSIIESENWLLKMYKFISKSNIGLVGSSASLQSICPTITLKDIFNKDKLKKINSLGIFLKYIFLMFFYPILFYFYGNFPNPHIRTNSFIISREDFLKINVGRFFFKFQTWYFESGRNSLSNRIEKLGKKLIVVGKDSKSFEKDQWKISNTFWNMNQDNLLISDNQTRKYYFANKEQRAFYRKSAWGRK